MTGVSEINIITEKRYDFPWDKVNLIGVNHDLILREFKRIN